MSIFFIFLIFEGYIRINKDVGANSPAIETTNLSSVTVADSEFSEVVTLTE